MTFVIFTLFLPLRIAVLHFSPTRLVLCKVTGGRGGVINGYMRDRLKVMTSVRRVTGKIVDKKFCAHTLAYLIGGWMM